MKLKLKCLFLDHKWYYTGRTADWLSGGTYFYECERCGKTKQTQPYQGL